MKKNCIVLIMVVLMAGFAFSAAAIEHTIGLRGGITLPYMDVDEEITNHFMGGISYEAWLKDYLSLGIYPYYTQLEGRESGTSFRSNLIGSDVMLRLRPVSSTLSLNFPESALLRISPFAQLGFGVVSYDSKILDSTIKDDGISITAPSLALGLSLQTKWRVNVDLGAQYVYTNTDKIDFWQKNVSESYLMPYLGVGFTFGSSEAKKAIDNFVPMFSRAVLRNRISMEQDFTLNGVQFEIGSANLTPEAKDILDEVAAAMQGSPNVKVEIQGHTDNTGSMALNERLSLERAESVKTYLIGRGIDSNRLATKGFGPNRPIATNDTPEGRTENRRIEFVIIK